MSYFEIWVLPTRVEGVLEREELLLSADVRVDSEPTTVSVEVSDARADAIVTLRNGLQIGLKGKGRGVGCVWRSGGREDGANGGEGGGKAEGGKGSSSSSHGGGLGKGGGGDYGGTAEHEHDGSEAEADEAQRRTRRRLDRSS